MTNKKQKYNLGDAIYYLNTDGHYFVHDGMIVGVNYNKLFDRFYYNIEYSSFTGIHVKKEIPEKYIFNNEEEAKKYAYLIFTEMCNDINDVINGRARFTSDSVIRDYLEKLQDLNKEFGFQLQIYPYECKKDLKKEIKRLKKELGENGNE